MKNKFIVLISIIFFCGFSSKAQDAISIIRTHYKFYTNQVSECKKGTEDCRLYNNKLTINEDDQPWRGVGQYKKETTFWYDDSPRHCDACGENGIYTLKLVSSTTTSGLTASYQEWLFKKGKLIFYYLKNTGEYESEFRNYYEDGVLIRYIENDRQLEGKEAVAKDSDKMKTKASNLQKSFLLGFQ